MKITVLQENLHRALNLLGSSIYENNALPIVQNVRLATTDHGMLELTATNMTFTISTLIGAQVDRQGSVTLPGKAFNELVGYLAAEKVEMEVPQDGNHATLHLTCAGNRTEMHGMPASDFPLPQDLTDPVVATMDAEALTTAINRTLFSAAKEESRPVLTGLSLHLKPEGFTMASADGFRLSVQHSDLLEPPSHDVHAVLPAKAMNELNRLMRREEQPVTIAVDLDNRSAVRFEVGATTLTSQILQGAFPNFDQLIPTDQKTAVTLEREGVQRRLKAAALFSGNGTIQMEYSREEPPADGTVVTDGECVVWGKDDQLGETRTTMPVEMSGEDNRIAFNGKYLQEAVQHMNFGKVTLGINDPGSPGVFRGEGDDSYVHVVMPMFVQW